MSKNKILFSSDFVKQFKKLPKQIQNKYYKKEKIFKENPFNSSLKSHQLSGKLKGCLAFYIDYHYRVVFKMDDDDYIFLQVGTHEIYK